MTVQFGQEPKKSQNMTSEKAAQSTPCIFEALILMAGRGKTGNLKLESKSFLRNRKCTNMIFNRKVNHHVDNDIHPAALIYLGQLSWRPFVVVDSFRIPTAGFPRVMSQVGSSLQESPNVADIYTKTNKNKQNVYYLCVYIYIIIINYIYIYYIEFAH